MQPLCKRAGISPSGAKDFIVDDNRSVVEPESSVSLNGLDYYLSIKGVGSITTPFGRSQMTSTEISSLTKDANLRRDIVLSKERNHRYITGELWSRGSPYGGQGLDYGWIALKASERATNLNGTSIHGFRIAPVVQILQFPSALQSEITKIYWYRKFKKAMVQEARLVPSNVRIYFHSDYTVGDDTCKVLDLFGIDTNDKAEQFEINFLRTGIAILTLLSRTIEPAPNGTYRCLDYYDVWLDKDAVIAPNGEIHWVDAEGLEQIRLWSEDIEEKMEYQIYRSMYEFMYAYEQIERVRQGKFGYIPLDRKLYFLGLLKEVLKDDEVVQLQRKGDEVNMEISTILGTEIKPKVFTILDL